MGFLAALPAALSTVFTAATAGATEAGGAAAISSAATTLAETAAVASLAGTAYSAYGTYKSALFQSKIAANNAQISEGNRISTLEAGNVEEADAKLATGRRIGAALAAQGANGVDVGFGSPAAVRTSMQELGDLDAATIRWNAARSALGYATQAAGYSSTSSADKATAGYDLVGGALGTGASFVSGSSSIAAQKYKFLTSGASQNASSTPSG